ncbi:zinc finger protein 236-like [Macrobrachium nipponense]|uniref:zinc finger protein 236-like n=1 Tax=Macrobrachium nipponense TaxID=159736 RepID=UPI0030C7F19E
MYQESSAVDNAEYHHIMYNYETLKLPPEAAAALKMTGVEADTVTLSASDSLPTVTLSAGESLVPSCISTSIPVTNVLTTTSLSEGVRLTAPSLSIATPLTCTSITNGIPLTAVTLTPTNSPSVVSAAVPSGHFSDGSVPSTLTVATMSDVDSSSVSAREDSLEIGQIVHTTDDGVLENSLVSSSSIDAVVTSMVASADCQGVVTNGRKIPSQVIAKLLSDDSLSLDMVRIITEQDVENESHQPQGFNMLARPGMLVHTKLADNDIVSGNSINPYRHVEVLNVRPTIRLDNEGSTHCSVVWTCAYCSMAFPSSEAVGQHHEKECTENQSITVATSSSATVESLISPLRQVDENTFELKLSTDKESQNGTEHDAHEEPVKDEEQHWSTEHESIWTCTICGGEFNKSEELGKHHLTHSIQDLSASLLKLTKPQRRAKVNKITAVPLPAVTASATVPSAVVLEQDNSNNCESAWNKSGLTAMEEELADNPGDTPPQTPPQESLTVKVKKKTGIKAPPVEKNDKKKGGKKTNKETKAPRQRKCKGRVVGQGSRDPHTCNICNKVLSCRGNLAKHLVTHASDKPFVCKPCGIGFNAKRDQQYHYLRYHTNERPNICEVCGKGYVFRQYLLKHMVFHGKERQFSCEICGKQFLTAKCVMRHKKRHKKEKLFKCTSCLKSFTVNADLKAHIRKIHRNNKKTSNIKQQQDSQHKVIQSVQSLQQKVPDSQSLKSKDITEFLLPSNATIQGQLLPAELEPATLSGTVSSKDEVFITPDPLGSIIPLSELPPNEYSASVAPIGDHTTYVMINSTDEEVASQNVSAAHGLNIMYAAATTPAQQVGELSRSHLSQGNLNQGQHMLVSSTLGDTTSQLSEGTLQHIESQTDLQHQAQETQTLAAVTEAGLDEGHQGDMNVAAGTDDHGSELAAATHDSVVHSSHDPGSGFHLELLSQTIQLELQRTQTSTANYLGISDR